MNKLTLVIPAKKESETLPKVIQQLKNLECKIIVSLYILIYLYLDRYRL